MTGADYNKRLHDLGYVCGVNQRYHQKLYRFWVILDKSNRLMAGALAVVMAVLFFLRLRTELATFWGALAFALAAVMLNLIPFGDWAKYHRELLRLWTELRKDTEQATIRGCNVPSEEPVPPYLIESISRLSGKSHSLDYDNPAPIRWLLRRCQENENQSLRVR